MLMTSDVRAKKDPWQRFRWLYTLSWLPPLVYLPIGGIVFAIVPASWANASAVVVFIIVVGTWVSASLLAHQLKCPRCGTSFFGALFLERTPILLIRQCRFCKLPIFA